MGRTREGIVQDIQDTRIHVFVANIGVGQHDVLFKAQRPKELGSQATVSNPPILSTDPLNGVSHQAVKLGLLNLKNISVLLDPQVLQGLSESCEVPVSELDIFDRLFGRGLFVVQRKHRVLEEQRKKERIHGCQDPFAVGRC